MQITLPKGYELPEGAKPGEPFDAVASITQNPDGTFTLSAIDGMDLDTEDEENEQMPEEEGEPKESENPLAKFAKSVKMPWSDEE
jgi:hypothetical protein